MTLTISPFGNPWQNQKHNYERSRRQQLHNYYKKPKVHKPNNYNKLLQNFARKKIMVG